MKIMIPVVILLSLLCLDIEAMKRTRDTDEIQIEEVIVSSDSQEEVAPNPAAQQVADDETACYGEEDLDGALCDAIKNMETERVKALLKRKASPNAINEKGKPALMQVVELLKEKTNNAPLHAKLNRILRLLCDAGADSSKADAQGKSVLDMSMSAQKRKILTDKRTKEEKLLEVMSIATESNSKASQIRLEDLIDFGANVNARDAEKGTTPLMCCMRNGLEKLVTILLDAGADPKLQDKAGYTAFTWAACFNCVDGMQLLLERDPSLFNSKSGLGSTPLMFAAQGGHERAVKFLLDNDADVNAKNNHGWTALMFACTEVPEWGQAGSREKIVRLLLEKKPSLDDADTAGSTDAKGTTALMLASAAGYDTIVRLLLDNNAEITKTDVHGNTALLWAITKNRIKIVEMLLKKGALHHFGGQKNADLMGLQILSSAAAAEKDPFTLAKSLGHEDIATLISNFGWINRPDNEGMTALHRAAIRGDSKEIKSLLDKGAGINSRNEEGMTALMLAAQQGHGLLVELLLTSGADASLTNIRGQRVTEVAKRDIIPFLTTKLSSLSTRNTPVKGRMPERAAERVVKKARKLTPVALNVPVLPPQVAKAVAAVSDVMAEALSSSDNRPSDGPIIQFEPEVPAAFSMLSLSSEVRRQVQNYAPRESIIWHAAVQQGVRPPAPMIVPREKSHIVLRVVDFMRSAIQNKPAAPLVMQVCSVNEVVQDAALQSLPALNAQKPAAQVQEAVPMQVEPIVASSNDKAKSGPKRIMALIEQASKMSAQVPALALIKKYIDGLLMNAVVKGDAQEVNELLDLKADPNAKNSEGITALHAAVMTGKAPIVGLLLDNNAAINAADNNGMTALLHAAKICSKDMIQLLLRRGANRHLQNGQGKTSLMLVAAQESTPTRAEIIATLLDEKSLEVRDISGKTFMDYLSSDARDFVRLILTLMTKNPQEKIALQ